MFSTLENKLKKKKSFVFTTEVALSCLNCMWISRPYKSSMLLDAILLAPRNRHYVVITRL